MGCKKSPSKLHKATPPAASVDPGNDPARRQACIDLAGGDEPMLFIDEHDDAILGVADRDGEDTAHLVSINDDNKFAHPSKGYPQTVQISLSELIILNKGP